MFLFSCSAYGTDPECKTSQRNAKHCRRIPRKVGSFQRPNVNQGRAERNNEKTDCNKIKNHHCKTAHRKCARHNPKLVI